MKKAGKKAAKKAVKKAVKKAAKPSGSASAKKAAAKAVKTSARKASKVKAAKKVVKSKAKTAVAKKTVVKAVNVVRKPTKAAARKPTGAKVKTPALRARPATAAVFSSIPDHHPPLVKAVLQQLEDAKAEQIVTIDLADRSSVADLMIVASGRSNRHVNAIADQVVEALEKGGKKGLRVEGKPQCDWVLVDSGDVIIHIFRPEVRSFYNLEKLWSAHAPGDAGAR